MPTPFLCSAREPTLRFAYLPLPAEEDIDVETGPTAVDLPITTKLENSD